MPQLSREQPPLSQGRILFRDAGFRPDLEGNLISLGPEQMGVIGFGKYAQAEYQMGIEPDVIIPQSISPIAAVVKQIGSHAIETSIPGPEDGAIRIVLQQRTPEGDIRRTWAGAPPTGENMGNVLKIEVLQHGQPLFYQNLRQDDLERISWGVGEVSHFATREPIVIRCSSTEKDAVRLGVNVYRIR